MEVVSNLCFGGHKPPEPDLIKMLMDTVFTEKKQAAVEDVSVDTRDMTPYQADPDQIPVVRSFLLQLLLEHKYVATCDWFVLDLMIQCWLHFFSFCAALSKSKNILKTTLTDLIKHSVDRLTEVSASSVFSALK